MVIHALITVLFVGAGQQYIEVPKFSGRTLRGFVTLSHTVPDRPPKMVTRDTEFCGDQVPDETYVVGHNDGLANVVVMLENVERGKTFGAPVHTMTHRWCRFVPHVLGMAKGSLLWIKNADPILHTTHAYLDGQTLFHAALPRDGAQSPKVINKPGIIQFACATGHTWMGAWAVVHDNPYVTVTDETGWFALTRVPAGIYTVKTWHEAEGVQRVKVRIDKDRDAKIFVKYSGGVTAQR